MRKAFLIAWYDLVRTFRNPVALVFMLLLPFALIFIMDAAFGGQRTGLEHIPVVVVNQDEGTLGQNLVAMLQSESLQTLLDVTVLQDAAEARAWVERDDAAAAVVIPSGVSSALGKPGTSVTSIRVYVNPLRPISGGVVRSIVRGFVDGVDVGVIGGYALFSSLQQAGGLTSDPAQIRHLVDAWTERMTALARSWAGEERVRLVSLAQKRAEGFDPIAFIVPSMAIFTLLFTMTSGGAVFLEERLHGTLHRLFGTPTSPMAVLVGKVMGIWWTGWAQLAILLGGSAVVFGISWGNPLLAALVCVLVVLAASGWGALIAAYASSPSQARLAGTTVSLVFGMTAGHFFPRENLPAWVWWLARVSPNAWGLDAFQKLLENPSFAAVAPALAALSIMTVVLFALAAWKLGRQLAET